MGTSLRGSDVSTNDCVNYLYSLIGITCHPAVASAESMYTKCHGHYTKVMSVDGIMDEWDTTMLPSMTVNLCYTGGGTEALLHLRPLDGSPDSARTNYALNPGERVAVTLNVHNGKSSVLKAPGRKCTCETEAMWVVEGDELLASTVDGEHTGYSFPRAAVEDRVSCASALLVAVVCEADL